MLNNWEMLNLVLVLLVNFIHLVGKNEQIEIETDRFFSKELLDFYFKFNVWIVNHKRLNFVKFWANWTSSNSNGRIFKEHQGFQISKFLWFFLTLCMTIVNTLPMWLRFFHLWNFLRKNLILVSLPWFLFAKNFFVMLVKQPRKIWLIIIHIHQWPPSMIKNSYWRDIFRVLW